MGPGRGGCDMQDTELEVILRSQNALEQFNRREEVDAAMQECARDYMDESGFGPKS